MKQIKCNNCGHFKMQRRSDMIAGGGALCLVLGLALTVLIIGIPIAIIGVGMIIYGVILRFNGKDFYKCKNCGQTQPVSA